MDLVETKPKFTHDCSNCEFLGTFKDIDLYSCNRGKQIDTVIARFSSAGSDYCSGLSIASSALLNGAKTLTEEALAEALLRALARGFLPRRTEDFSRVDDRSVIADMVLSIPARLNFLNREELYTLRDWAINVQDRAEEEEVEFLKAFVRLTETYIENV